MGASLLSMLVVSLMVGNSFIVMAGSAPPPSDGVNGLQYIDGNWNVNTAVTLTNEVIVLTGNLTVQGGGSLTLVNTTVYMNCTSDGEYHIEIMNAGSLILMDGGDGVTPNEAGDSDFSLISVYDTTFRTYFWAWSGSTFTATNSKMQYIGCTGGDDRNSSMYFQTPNVQIIDCYIDTNGNGLYFDSVFPASLAGTVIDDCDNYGVWLANHTTNGWACNGVLRDFTVKSAGSRGIMVEARNINIEVANVNVTGCEFGLTVLAETAATANVHHCSFWNNWGSEDSAGAYGSSIYILANGWGSTSTAIVEDNVIVNNYCSAVWVGYEYEGVRSNHTNVRLNRNYLFGNEHGNVFHAVDTLTAHAEGNYFSGSTATGYGDGLNIGTGKGVECMDYDFGPGNMTFQVLNNRFEYPTNGDYVEVCGVLRTGATWAMDATVVGNTVTGANTGFGGIFQLGAPVGGETAGEDMVPRVRYLTALVEDNTVDLKYNGASANIGGVFIFNALENANVKMLNNDFRSLQGGTGGIVEVQGGHHEYGLTLKNATVLIHGNKFFSDPENSDNLGGYIRIRAYLNVDVTITGNTIEYNDDGDGNTGGIIRIGTYHWEYTPSQINLKAVINDNFINLYNEDSYDVGGIIRLTSYENMNAEIKRNKIQAVMYDAIIGGVIWVGKQGSSYDDDATPSIARNVTLDVSSNIIDIFSVAFDQSIDLGGLLWIYATEKIDAKFNDNKVTISMFSDYWDDKVNGFIRSGIHGEAHTAKELKFQMRNNDISITLSDTELNGFVRLFAHEKIEADISDNKVAVRFQGSEYYVGGMFIIGSWGNETDHSNTTDFVDGYTRFNLETYLNFNRNDVRVWLPYYFQRTGGMMRVIGREVTVVNMADNVLQANYAPAPTTQTHEDDMYDFGIRIGKHGFCTDDPACLISTRTTVTMSNNIIGPGGKGSALFIAGRTLEVSADGGTVQGGIYDDSTSCSLYETSHGSGVTLWSPNSITASFSNMNFLNNRGAGLYVSTPGVATVDVRDSYFVGNDWGGIRMKGYYSGRITGTISNCQVMGSVDEWGRYTEPTAAMHFERSNFLVLNSTLVNPKMDSEFNATHDSHITARNTIFDKERAIVEPTAACMISGKNTEYPGLYWYTYTDQYWSTINNGAFNITIDGFSANVGPIDFTGATTRVEVAARIQAAIRAVPGAPDGFLNATVNFIRDNVYQRDTRSLKITSGTKGAGSSISPLSVYNGPGVFTDISGKTFSSPAGLILGPGIDRSPSDWNSVTDGTFRIAIDGHAANVGPINFVGVGNMQDVAARIETAIRAVPAAPAGFTGATVRYIIDNARNYYTCVIWSGTITGNSKVSSLTPHSLGTGTDISGTEVNGWGYWWLDGTADWAQVVNADSWMDMSQNATVYPATSSDLLVQWFLDVKTVRADNGMAILDANVTARNLSNAVIGTATTGNDGWARGIIASEYLQTPTTKTYYTPHTVSAVKGNATGSAIPAPTMDVSKSVIITLDYVPVMPVADAGPDQSVLGGTLATFNGTASTGDQPMTYTWFFNNGTANITLDGALATYNCTIDVITPGSYNVTLTITDFWGNEANDTMVLTVVDPNPPVANAGPDQTVNEDAVVTFSGAASSDYFPIANYTWTLTDGGAVTMYGVAPTHIFAEPGVYVVTLTVTDIDDNTDMDTVTITVLDVTEPVANAGLDQTVPEGSIVNFVGSASLDNVAITVFEWTFVDGSNTIILTGATPSYTFVSIGDYEVTLTVLDAAGNSDADTMWVHVTDATPPAVLVIAPGDALTSVPLNWSLVIVFTEPMNKTSVQDAFNISGGAIPTFTWDATGMFVTISFVTDLAPDTLYTFTIDTNATDTSGNQLTATFTGTFRTAATPETPETPEPEEPETNFFTNNWWILMVIIVVLAVLLLVSLLRGGKKEPEAPVAAGTPPAPPAEPAAEPAPAEPVPEEPAPEAPAEEEIQ
jgi:PKD repeat protein